jgi:hypothetical protein
VGIAAYYSAAKLASEVLQRLGDGVHRRENGVYPIVANNLCDPIGKIHVVMERQPGNAFLIDEKAVVVDTGSTY